MRHGRWFWAILMLVVALVIRFWPQFFQLMLLRSFAFQFLVGFGAITVYWAFRGRALNSAIGVLSVVIINSFLPPVLTHSEGRIDDENGIVIAHFNVLMVNKDHGSTIAQALNSDADLISFQEVNKRWAKDLSTALSCKYPFSKIIARSNNYGIAVFSKTPFNDVWSYHSAGDPSIEGCVTIKGQDLHFIATHTRSPLPYYNYLLRNEQIDEIAERIAVVDGPKIVLGDLNAVPWDEKVVQLRRDTGLKDSRSSLASTFPKYGGVAKIPIDHILHSPELKCLGFKTISGMSSDHLGVIGVYKYVDGVNKNSCG